MARKSSVLLPAVIAVLSCQTSVSSSQPPPGGTDATAGSGGSEDAGRDTGPAGGGGLAGGAGQTGSGGSIGPDDASAEPDGIHAEDGAGEDTAAEADGAATTVDWEPGLLGSSPPASSTLLPLPGEGVGPPVVTSNNPETFTSLGYLYQTARASAARGGGPFPLSGRVGVYLHHMNQSGAQRYVQVVVTNPGNDDVTVSAFGSGYNQTETGGLGLGYGPDFQVAEDWLTGSFQTHVPPTKIAPLKPLQLFVKSLNHGAELDARLELDASSPVYFYVAATATSNVNDVIQLSSTEAQGNIASPGSPPPPFGREAGVYAHDRWQGEWTLDVPEADAHVGFMVNTALGSGMPQDQAFPALTRFDDSSAESVGNYGNTYDLTVHLRLGPQASSERRVRVLFAGNVPPTSPLTFQWNGPALVDGHLTPVLIRPQAPMQELAAYVLAPGEARTFTFQAPVPGLTSIWQMILFESSTP